MAGGTRHIRLLERRPRLSVANFGRDRSFRCSEDQRGLLKPLLHRQAEASTVYAEAFGKIAGKMEMEKLVSASLQSVPPIRNVLIIHGCVPVGWHDQVPRF